MLKLTETNGCGLFVNPEKISSVEKGNNSDEAIIWVDGRRYSIKGSQEKLIQQIDIAKAGPLRK